MSTRYRFNKNVCDLLKPKILNYNLTKLARKLAEFILKKNCIPHFQHPFELYHTALAEEVIDVKTKKFHEKFIKNENISEDAQKFRKAFRDEMNKQSHGKFKLENMDNLQITLELSRNFGQGEHKDWPSNTITDDDIQDFLDHLVLAVNQPNEDELGKLIEKEIGKEFDAIKSETLFNKLFMTMLTWIQDRDRSEFFSYEEGKQLLEEATRGFPVWFDVSPPAENFIGRLNIIEKLHQILLEAGSRAISQRICISGLGGIGKSELVRKYIHTYRASFDEKIVWINAESYKTLVESFCRLAQDKLRIPIIKDDKRINMKSIIEKVYNYFSDGKSLFIFDNAMKLRSQEEDDEGIDKFLPSSSPHVKNPYIIITSRNQRWGDLKTIVLESFTLEEAAEFIEKALNIKDGSQVTEIQDLNKKLQYFPLALQQAVAYIKERNRVLKNFDSVFTINNYLLEYDEKTKKLLNFKFPEDSDNKYTKTTYTTWKVSTDIIKTNKKCGFKAMQILNMIAYTASSNISVKIFLKFKNRETLEEAIQLLKQYSLINSEERETLVRVHELVQQVIRIDLKEAKREKDVIKKTLGLLSNTLLQNSFRYNVDHALSVWNYASKYEELVRKFSRVPAVIVKKLSILLRYQNACTFGKMQ
ncbi:hypothetical protein HHI36_006775 [Cryptolaemus montrouzieri]|uniref:NB-ARC domain-containing protein n=1 Tax=Cryptolaemus montrouzieri TaxID=559131 RepID=A0ABD2NY45_9CUCU